MALSKIDLSKMITGTLATGNGGTGATSYAPGKVLQVQSFYTHAGISTSDTSYAATVVTDAITPSATSSKVVILINGGRSSYGSGTAEGSQKLYRQIGGGGYSEVRVMHLDMVNEAGGYGKPSVAFSMLDSPSTTSAIDYKVYIKTNANTYHFNSGGAQIGVVLMEIGA